MDVATRISLLLILCGNVHVKDLNSTIIAQGNNATIYFDMPKWDGKTILEINFYGYTSTQHFTNILLYNQRKDHKENISINSNYTGRIEGVVNSNDHFSFLLLNLMFNDSGNYTIKENSNVKGNTYALVTRRIYVAQLWEPMIFSFTVYEHNTSFIIVDKFTSQRSQPVVIYNFTNAICSYRDVVSRVEKNFNNCVLSNGEFSFTIPEIGWLHKGSYFAWDDKGLLLDSIVLDIQGNTKTVSVENFSPFDNGTRNTMTGSVETPSRLDIGKGTLVNPLLYVVLVIGGIIIAFLAYLRHKFRIRLQVSRLSNIDTSKVCNKEKVGEIVQKENSLEGYLTVISSEKSEFSTANEPLFDQNVVIGKHELQHSMRLDSGKDNDALDGYLNPIKSCAVEFDEFMNTIPTCSVEFEEYVRPNSSSSVNSGIGITHQSCSTEFDEYIRSVSSSAEELYQDICYPSTSFHINS